ncbi:MAG: amidohydrolase family protein, partial [Bdellovibrionales bacterium]|nr:amidohydrolase family protein [Bdellovibrionales bacterium]
MGIKNLKSYSHGELQQQPSLLFENTTLVSPDHNIISGYILIKGSHIAGLGEGATPEDLLTDATVIDASDFLITPSFINAHSHVAMNMFRDLAHQQESMIYKLFFPWEKNLDKEIVGALSFPYILGGLLSGTSTFADHYYFEEGIILALKAFGLKGIIGETTADLGSAFPSYDKWQGTKKWLESWP